MASANRPTASSIVAVGDAMVIRAKPAPSRPNQCPGLSASPADDHWPTVADLLETNGDDCDGLDLIAYQLLIEFGFDRRELYRAIVRSDKGTGNHMITLWFEGGTRDPWVFDATGAVTTEMVRFSQVFGWYPIKVFNEHTQYTVGGEYRRRAPGPAPARGMR